MCVCVADVCCCRCRTPGPDKDWPNKHNTSNMRAVDKRILHTLNTDHTWLLPSPNRASFIQYFFGVFLCTYHRLCVCVLSLCFLQSHSHRITQHCAKGYSSTKAFSITITSSSLFFSLSVSASISAHHVRLFASSSVSEISAISADCHIVCVCLLACLLVYESKVRYVPEEVKWILWPSV